MCVRVWKHNRATARKTGCVWKCVSCVWMMNILFGGHPSFADQIHIVEQGILFDSSFLSLNIFFLSGVFQIHHLSLSFSVSIPPSGSLLTFFILDVTPLSLALSPLSLFLYLSGFLLWLLVQCQVNMLLRVVLTPVNRAVCLCVCVKVRHFFTSCPSSMYMCVGFNMYYVTNEA